MLKATILRQTSNSLLYRSTHANIDQPPDMPLHVEFNQRMTEVLKRGNWVLDIPSLHTHTHTTSRGWENVEALRLLLASGHSASVPPILNR